MKLTDVAPVETWQKLVEKMYEKFGVNFGVLDKDNVVINKPAGWANDACPLIKGNENSRVVCASAQQDMANEANETKKTVVSNCDVGFSKFVIPIFFNDEFLGTTGGCGVIIEDEELDDFYISKVLNISEEKARKLIENVKILSNEDLDEIVKYSEKALAKIMSL